MSKLTENDIRTDDLAKAMRLQALADAAQRRLDQVADAIMNREPVAKATFEFAATRAAGYREEARRAWDKWDRACQ